MSLINAILLGWNLTDMIVNAIKNRSQKNNPETTDLGSNIAQNQIWGENVLASGLPYDEYSHFANPGTQTMGQNNMSYPNPGLPMKFMGYPGENKQLTSQMNMSDLIRKLLEYYRLSQSGNRR